MKEPLYSKKSEKVLSSLDKLTQERIKSGVAKIPNGNIRPLKGSDGDYRLRIGDWRILFTYADKETVRVLKIAPRGDVYKGA